MQKTSYQKPEIRNSNDEIIQNGAYGKNTPFCNSQNTGILDFINNNLEWLYDNKANKSELNNYLPLSGGTVSNDIIIKNNDVDVNNVSADSFRNIIFRDKNNKTTGILRNIVSQDGSVECFLSAIKTTESGQQVWNTISAKYTASGSSSFQAGYKEIERVNASSTNYIRFESGLQICWGSENITATKQITYPAAFIGGRYTLTVSTNSNGYCWATSADNTSFYFNCSNFGTGIIARYIAIGRWK